MDAGTMIAESHRQRARAEVIDRLTTITAALVAGRNLGTLDRDSIRDTVTIARELLNSIETQVANG